MRRRAAETSTRRGIDWRGWIALIWALWFGSLYVRMVLEQRAPRLLDVLRDVTARIIQFANG
jgi:hypothetical protein